MSLNKTSFHFLHVLRTHTQHRTFYSTKCHAFILRRRLYAIYYSFNVFFLALFNFFFFWTPNITLVPSLLMGLFRMCVDNVRLGDFIAMTLDLKVLKLS